MELINEKMRGRITHHPMRGSPRMEAIETDLKLGSHCAERLCAS